VSNSYAKCPKKLKRPARCPNGIRRDHFEKMEAHTKQFVKELARIERILNRSGPWENSPKTIAMTYIFKE